MLKRLGYSILERFIIIICLIVGIVTIGITTLFLGIAKIYKAIR